MIIIALGSNISGPWGTPRETLQRALEELPRQNIRIRTVSTFLETAPMGPQDQPNFVNAAAVVETKLLAPDLMQLLHAVERHAGRERLKRWGPRTLDLDLIDYNSEIRSADGPAPTLPHPGIAERDFVLKPIAEIAPEWKHPVTHLSAALMLRQLNRLKTD
jgi:2-amino-4-hydroxy-6-hydroxymethyldihydropteridine diphosphokinase